MSITKAEIAGLIAAADGTAAAFEHFSLESRHDIDSPGVCGDIERRIVACSFAVKACLNHMISMDIGDVRACIEIAKMIVRTVYALKRLQPASDLEHVLILEEVLYEERLGEMYAHQASIQRINFDLQRIMDEPDDTWWRGDQH